MKKNNYKLIFITITIGAFLIFWTSIKTSVIEIFEKETQTPDTSSFHEIKIKIDSLQYTNYSIEKYNNLFLDINLRLSNDLISAMQSQELITLCCDKQIDELKNSIDDYLVNDKTGNSQRIKSFIKNYKSIRNNFDFSYYESQIKFHDYYISQFSNDIRSFVDQQQTSSCWDSKQFDKYFELCKLKDVNSKYKNIFSSIVNRNQSLLENLFQGYGSLPDCPL